MSTSFCWPSLKRRLGRPSPAQVRGRVFLGTGQRAHVAAGAGERVGMAGGDQIPDVGESQTPRSTAEVSNDAVLAYFGLRDDKILDRTLESPDEPSSVCCIEGSPMSPLLLPSSRPLSLSFPLGRVRRRVHRGAESVPAGARDPLRHTNAPGPAQHPHNCRRCSRRSGVCDGGDSKWAAGYRCRCRHRHPGQRCRCRRCAQHQAPPDLVQGRRGGRARLAAWRYVPPSSH